MKDRHKLFCAAWNGWIVSKRGKAMVAHAEDGLTGKPFLNVLLLAFRAGYEARRKHAAVGRGGCGNGKSEPA